MKQLRSLIGTVAALGFAGLAVMLTQYMTAGIIVLILALVLIEPWVMER